MAPIQEAVPTFLCRCSSNHCILRPKVGSRPIYARLLYRRCYIYDYIPIVHAVYRSSSSLPKCGVSALCIYYNYHRDRLTIINPPGKLSNSLFGSIFKFSAFRFGLIWAKDEGNGAIVLAEILKDTDMIYTSAKQRIESKKQFLCPYNYTPLKGRRFMLGCISVLPGSLHVL